MIGRLALFSAVLIALAQSQPWNCKAEIGSLTWDLTALDVEKTLTRTWSSPPSTFEDEIRFNLCDVLKRREGYDSLDQCSSGALACLTETNKKPNDGSDRITAVVPLAVDSDLDVQYRTNPPSNGLSLLLHGGRYPTDSPESPRQAFNITLLCDASSDFEPTLKSISVQDGGVWVEWKTPSACAHDSGGGSDDQNTPPPGSPTLSRSSGGFGWFFTLLLLVLVLYFGLGAYSNYTNYGSRGWDLVPHRDFWRDVPYLMKDLLQHLFKTISGSHSRNGYVAV